MTTTQSERLRIVADLLDAHPGLPIPSVFAYAGGSVDVSWQICNGDDDLDQKAALRDIVRSVGGLWNKSSSADRFYMDRDWRGIRLSVVAAREQVCTRRVVGTETVTVPAVEAQPERTEVREIVEWDCEPVLGDAPEAVAS